MSTSTKVRVKSKTAGYFATVPPQEILPIVNSRFESSVSGIYVIGDVTGLPLVKVAANQGVDVITKMVDRGVFKKTDAEDDRLDLVIIGGGPAGLSAALEAKKRGLKYVVLERNRIASTIRSFPPGKTVYAEPRFLPNSSKLELDADLDKDEFLARLDRLTRDEQLAIKEETEVKQVRKLGEHRFSVETKSGRSFPTRHVLVAIGRQGHPRRLTCPGADLTEKVTYRFHTPEDYHDKDVLVVGGGNSAIETALMLTGHNRVTLSYRGEQFYRAKEENRRNLERAERDGQLTVLYKSNVIEIREREVDIDITGAKTTIANDHVIVQIGNLPPVDFLMDMGLELDGVWTKKRVVMSLIGLVVGFFIYFVSKHFVLLPEFAGTGRIYLPGLARLSGTKILGFVEFLTTSVLPAAWFAMLAGKIINKNRTNRGLRPPFPLRHANTALALGALTYGLALVAPNLFTLDARFAGPGPFYVPGFAWLYRLLPTYFANLYGMYYLLYFAAITIFGLFWAYRARHGIIWRRNLTIIITQWTLWWGIPTMLAVVLGRNVWTPLISKSINAWPLNTGAFQSAPAVGPGDPAWWQTVAIVGVLWAVFLTFIVIPLLTIRWGKIYCSYFCSCGALAETVGNGFRHRGPKGDRPRRWERAGFLFILLASLATIADLSGFSRPLHYYNVWVGTALSGAIAIGLYPFLGQRIWCRMWCPLAFWMNFWGRWSNFKISPEKGKCIDCNVCNQFCQMGIDIKSRAMQGRPVTLVDSPCVGCAECVVRCPMEILHLGALPGTASTHANASATANGPLVQPRRSADSQTTHSVLEDKPSLNRDNDHVDE